MTPDAANAVHASHTPQHGEASLRAERIIGYCTNVHAGATLEQTQSNLKQHALAVKTIVSPHHPMGIGLRLSARAAR
ncbi:MAG TPA: hypothetical protein PK400_11795, partial [Phycisphaerales bacterium]|nr:hypothetical protein [Phycisphaerales bacterium]